MMNTRRDNKN